MTSQRDCGLIWGIAPGISVNFTGRGVRVNTSGIGCSNFFIVTFEVLKPQYPSILIAIYIMNMDNKWGKHMGEAHFKFNILDQAGT